MNAEGRRTRLNTPMKEYERVQRQFRCHKASIVKTPLHEVPVAVNLLSLVRVKSAVVYLGQSSRETTSSRRSKTEDIRRLP
ncbi:hypothetical protein ALC62_08436 [Cyphomyrmex costatus]|uniref:Uncharacterized protein n=1 Tax=Cyphomyrmex costatus TaxID=456900 RepID=A0A195CJ59_9HYME|nr:hypothetical protein ALC62_08436 [Cyphomyrmex costatus]